jgi:multidrug resistance protein MdtO
MSASTQPALASIWGFIYCTVIAFWERPAPADALVKGSLYLVATVSLAFVCTATVEYVFAYRHAAERLSAALRQRFQLVERVYTSFAQGATGAGVAEAIAQLNRLAATGQRPMLDLYSMAARHGGLEKGEAWRSEPGGFPLGSRAYISMVAQLMDNAAAFASRHPDGVELALRPRCAEIARLCRERPVLEPVSEQHVISPSETHSVLDHVEMVLHEILSAPEEAWQRNEQELEQLPVDRAPFLMPDALYSKDTVAFALKVTLCAMVCYVFYFAVGWPGISTSVTTVFITALGTSGAIKQKLFNRFIGSTIGGALAIGATVFLFPHMDSIASLVVLVAAVAFVSAWWAAGRQFGYAGLQIAFAFYLVAFEGFSAPTDLTPPRDRLVGIMVALLVMWVVFDQLWPVRTITMMRRTLVGVLRTQIRFLKTFDGPGTQQSKLNQTDVIRDQIARAIAGLRTMNDTVVYEFGTDRERHIQIGDAILQSVLASVPFFWSQLAELRKPDEQDFITEPRLIDMRSKAVLMLDRLTESVARGLPVETGGASKLADAFVLGSARYGEYAQNTVACLAELEARVSELVIISSPESV